MQSSSADSHHVTGAVTSRTARRWSAHDHKRGERAISPGSKVAADAAEAALNNVVGTVSSPRVLTLIFFYFHTVGVSKRGWSGDAHGSLAQTRNRRTNSTVEERNRLCLFLEQSQRLTKRRLLGTLGAVKKIKIKRTSWTNSLNPVTNSTA